MPVASVGVWYRAYTDVVDRRVLQRRVQLGTSEPLSDMEGGGDHSLNSR